MLSSISICLLCDVLFSDRGVPHHRFQLPDAEHGRTLAETIEVHTVELAKYNIREEAIAEASQIEKWVFFLRYADRYDAGRLRALFPEEPFQQAISEAERIAERTVDRMMYDQREKALRDYQWAIESARREGLEKGREQGREEGVLIGKIQVLEQLLGDTPTPTARLLQRSVSELNAMVAQLQERLRHRRA